MDEVFLVSVFVLCWLTYKHIKIIKNSEIPKQNLLIAWSICSFSLVALVVVNTYY
ncbi:hypothetical protein ACQCVP_01890 [Rossellomorea vietnamensis]|uniref:hypothetical protein n=1 Tax=Rossellomorea vietnamensis TaxID=218284 RepID=UPI003CF5701D